MTVFTEVNFNYRLLYHFSPKNDLSAEQLGLL